MSTRGSKVAHGLLRARGPRPALAASLGLHRAARGLTSKTYVVLMEVNGEHENTYHFIRREGNETALRHLQTQLGRNGGQLAGGRGIFRLDLDHPVSITTVEEMLKIESNGYAFCTKLDDELRVAGSRFTERSPPATAPRGAPWATGLGERIRKFFD